MYELTKVGEHTYYIKSLTNIGVYVLENMDAYLIDSGNDKDAGRKLLSILSDNGWNLKGIINTHSNADHIGGNQLIQRRTGCRVISTEIENIIAKHPILESSFLYGGYPCKELRNKFLMADSSTPTNSIPEGLPLGLEAINLPGHYFDMIGIKTSDDVIFLADSVFSEEILEKYHISFLYDIKEQLKTLSFIESLSAKIFIPSHGIALKEIKQLIEANRNNTFEVIKTIMSLCQNQITFDELLQKVFEKYSLKMDMNQYVLVGSTIKSYLSYLSDEELITFLFKDNKLYYQITNKTF